jgi:hypothetical protein
MAKKTLKTTPKISVKIWQPLIDPLEAKINSACLRRDAYLTKVLERELDWLDEEVSTPNSQDSCDYITERLDRLPRKLVSLALPTDLTRKLNEICVRKRIVRDAFFNRLYLLLTSSPKHIDQLLFPESDQDWRKRVWSEYQHDGPFPNNGFYPLEPVVDPFWAIRCGLEICAEDDPTIGNLYTTVFESRDPDRVGEDHDLLALSCYLPDRLIPGHSARRKYLAELDEMLERFLGRSP